MSVLLLGIIIGFVLAILVVATFLGLNLRRVMRDRDVDQLRYLERHHARLKVIVGELLAKADEVDTSSKYIQDQLDDDTMLRLAETCSELVLLGDVTNSIEELIRARDFQAARKALLHACELAALDSRKLRAIKHVVRDSENGPPH